MYNNCWLQISNETLNILSFFFCVQMLKIKKCGDKICSTNSFISFVHARVLEVHSTDKAAKAIEGRI